MDDVKRFTAKVNELCEELEQRTKQGVGVAAKDVPRIMISGSPMAVPNWKVHIIVESVGATVVVEESCVGTRYFTDAVESKGESLKDQLWAIDEKYSKFPAHASPQTTKRIESIKQLAEQFKVDGVIYYTLQNCHDYNVEGVKS